MRQWEGQLIDPAWVYRNPPARAHSGPPVLYEHCGLKALIYPDFIDVIECDIKTDKAGFIVGWEV